LTQNSEVSSGIVAISIELCRNACAVSQPEMLAKQNRL